MDDSDRPGDQGKRRAYLVLVTVGLLSAVLLMAAESDKGPVEAVLYPAVIIVDIILLVGLATRRLPIRWADWAIFGVLAGSMAAPLLGWHLTAGTQTDTQVVALMLWAGLLFPTAFVVFGTRRGVAVSVVTYLLLVAGLAGPTGLAGGAATTPLLGDVAMHVAFAYAAGITLLRLLSARLELLTQQQARADFLEAQATTDVLTGVPNRRRLTDEFDHDGGDRVLIGASQRLAGAVRASDIVDR